MDPQPGDFAVVNVPPPSGAVISFAEWLAGGGRDAEWNHAVIATRRDYDGSLLIVEALPGGSREVAWHYEDQPHKWSTGIIGGCPRAATQARALVAIPYSWADYAAIGLHRLGVSTAGLQGYIASSHHLICSQLVDLAWLRAGCHLFDDGRWPGFVMPSDLGQILTSLLRPPEIFVTGTLIAA